jgi:hypothetical protein
LSDEGASLVDSRQTFQAKSQDLITALDFFVSFFVKKKRKRALF